MLKKYALEIAFVVVTALFLWVERLGLIPSVTVALGALLIILFLNDTFVSRGIKKALGDIKKEYLYSVLVLIVVALLAIWGFKIESIVFLGFFIAFALYDWDSRIVAVGALVSLASCPVLLVMKQDAYAEYMAVYAYYFLVMTVVLQIIEYKRYPERFKEEKE